ncbi:hypothetical protein J6590_054296, partial [Homalodisca vitripennis]
MVNQSIRLSETFVHILTLHGMELRRNLLDRQRQLVPLRQLKECALQQFRVLAAQFGSRHLLSDFAHPQPTAYPEKNQYDCLVPMPTINQELAKIFFINIQGLREKCEELELLLCQNKYFVACLAEHWLNTDEIELWVPEGFSLGSSFCRSVHIRGG